MGNLRGIDLLVDAVLRIVGAIERLVNLGKCNKGERLYCWQKMWSECVGGGFVLFGKCREGWSYCMVRL